MLTLNDLQAHFAAIPRDFSLTINGIEQKCNKKLLSTFSNVINSIAENQYSCEIPVKNESVDAVIRFLHGQTVDFSQNSFECLCVAAHMDIQILQSRLNSLVESFLTDSNFENCYKALKDYPKYCQPLFSYFGKNQAFFQSFTKLHKLDTNFVNCLLSQTSNLFNSEDEKALYIFSVIDDNSDMSLFSNINLCELTEETLYELLNHPLAEKFSPYLHTIKLFEKQLNIYESSVKRLNEMTKNVENLKIKYDKDFRINEDISIELDKTAIDCSIAEQKRANLQIEIESILSEFNILNSFVNSLESKNESFRNFLHDLKKMKKFADELVQILQTFHDIGGKVIYPGSSPSSLKIAKQWKEANIVLITKLKEISIKKNEYVQIKELLKSMQEILSDLIVVEYPIVKKNQ
ncbi:hypothetical protein TRFO_03479 [Tritrichomonas foetus]|uniref:BTB domain-containing protein n=1 Tax=Tritrichomonas foetus TaxID=1144522 RepID=A0A1J4KP37_9EUKA|nr:hypothetical protein TRFO_03479 [Tritrichomonas foetus]|eukprot:OHT13057.1 hypothetical protein TRFO_03479 [Tritrichomonas foetus]